MNILNGTDMLNLSIFRCGVCAKRLQYPIMEIKQFGNVCGSCLERAPYAEPVQNEELCLLMEKLHFPCNSSEDGCTFFGPFRKTCEHEKRCVMRKGLCPFAYNYNCDTLLCMIEIVSHINQNHKDNILTVEDGCVMVQNPSDTNREFIHLFQIDQNWFLIRSLFKNEAQKILYTFYRLSDSIAAENIKFYSDAFDEEREKCRVMHVSELKYRFDVENAFSASLCRLKCLKFDQRVKILIQNDTFSKNVEVEQARKVWFQCQTCSKIFKQLRFCTKCRVNVLSCETCHKTCLKCNGTDSVCHVNLSNVNVSYAFLCQSPGCNQVVPGDIYGLHGNIQCRFKNHKCVFCDEEYTVQNIIEHILVKHQSVVNPKMCTIEKLNTLVNHVFVNDMDVFILRCWVSSYKTFHVTFIKLIEPYWDNTYTWKIHIKSKENSLELVILGDCTMSRHYKEINVSEFMVQDNLKFTVHIARM